MSNAKITVPDLGGISSVTVIEIAVKTGDLVKKNDLMLVLESDKAAMEIMAEYDLQVQSIVVKMGDVVKHGNTLFEVLASDIQFVETPASENLPSEIIEEKKQEGVEAPKTVVDFKPESVIVRPDFIENNEVHAGPSVRRMARELGVDLGQVKASGPKNRIVKEDIDLFVKTKLQTQVSEKNTGISIEKPHWIDPTTFGPVRNLTVSNIMKSSSKHLHQSWIQVPHVTQFDEADITDLEDFRQALNKDFEREGVKFTILAFVIKAVSSLLQKFEKFRSTQGQNPDEWLIRDYYHIGFAADTPQGLVVPVIREANLKTVKEIAQEMKVLSQKARDKKLSLNDMQGGTFTISSLGGIGGTFFTPIVNTPEVAILGLSKSQIKPVWNKNEFAPRLILPLSLSYDHRIIDGADAARFTTELSKILSDIRLLVL